MNIELLSDGKAEGSDGSAIEEPLILPQTEPISAQRSKRIISAVIMLSCFILCSLSLALHAAALCKAAGQLWDNGRRLLISAVIPGAEVHMPTLPQGGTGSTDNSENKTDGNRENENSADDAPVIAEYMSADLSSEAEGAIDISNETSYDPDIGELYRGARPVCTVSTEAPEPLVLIYHTHGTEAYAESAASSFRSSDITKNVVAVGGVVTDVLGDAGITAIHLEEMFDSENWSAAYDTSTVAVRAALKKYPSIKYIFDLHRDCIGNDDAGYIRSLGTYNGIETAQLMFVCGTDQGGSGHTTWQKNLAFALQLQGGLWNTSKNLMRPIDLRCASFYQDTGSGAMLAEVGTCANSLTEAKRAAVLFASSLADYIYGKDCGLSRAELIEKYCG